MEFILNSLEDLPVVSQKILNNLKHKIICFEANMGVGKTTFVKSLIKQMGSSDNVSSPTYSIVNEYDTKFGKVFHFDFYRLNNEEEALNIGLEDYIYSNHYCFIEWPDIVQEFIPSNHHKIKINSINNQRNIIFV